MWKDSYTDDYRVNMSYAAYWIKNLLFIFEKGILTFLDQIVAWFYFQAFGIVYIKEQELCWNVTLIIDKSVSGLNYIGQV